MRVITLNTDKKVISVKSVEDNYVLEENDIVTDLGDIGQIMQEDGTFITPPLEPIEAKPTLEEQLEQIKKDNVIVMDALATVYEEILTLKGGA